MPFLLGLTGNIACGKSTVGQLLATRYGADYMDADRLPSIPRKAKRARKPFAERRLTVAEIASALGVSRATIYRCVRATTS